MEEAFGLSEVAESIKHVALKNRTVLKCYTSG